MTVKYPGATWLPVVNHGVMMSAHLGLILHVQVGNGSLHSYFDNPATKASSTWWCSKKGATEQYVDASLEAWAQAAGNATYNSVETEGYPTEPLTDAQIHALAELYAWGVHVYHWPLVVTNTPGIPGLGTHKMGGTAWSPQHHNCPGDIRTAQRQSIIDAARAIVTPPKPKPPVPPVVHRKDMEMWAYRVGAVGGPNYMVGGGALIAISEADANDFRANGGVYSEVAQSVHDQYVAKFGAPKPVGT